MKNTLYLLTLSVILFSCKATKQLAVQPTQERTITITETVHDTTLIVKADTVRLAAKLMTDTNGNITVQSKKLTQSSDNKKSKEPQVSIVNNTLTVDCFCDSASIYFKWKETQKTDSTVIVKVLPPVIIEKPFTKWQKIQLWAGRIFMSLLSLYIFLFILKRLKYI